ncbi:GGDEF domain-containing protein [Acinetobacter rongchengensis]|uniref:diguanylate cyclase n=1 Tax=Acinetobacter rongchengensis TaxID=2419601 RepID=A0A3A8EUB0_9GAMM|nr:GGDEF domain-containing protein [Acinetobacter rongchengensis]RKG38447.1 GGDEF domain-containing protein [Acinetobacter rongchengensis]
MAYLMMQFEKLFLRNTVLRRVFLLLMITVWGVIDLATGYEYSFAVFYLVPVSIAAWYDNKNMAIFTIILSALTWLYADYGAGHHYSNPIIPYWNACARLGFFSVVAFLLFKIKRSLTDMTLMAMKDSLTSLNNTRAFNLEYQTLKRRYSKKDQTLAVGIIDLDGFKTVNDTYGHSKGDDVLVEFAHVLKETMRMNDVVARMGGDEFVVILQDTNSQGIEDYAKRLRNKFLLSGLKQQYGVDFSMGIRVYTELPDNLDEATHQADQLMYQSKARGKSQTTISAQI